MGEAMRTIAFKVRTASCGATACINTFGDEQLAVDMLANKLLFEVKSGSSYLSLKIAYSVYSYNWILGNCMPGTHRGYW